MSVEFVRKGTWALFGAAWALLVVDALPWGLDLPNGLQGLVRVLSVVTVLVLIFTRGQSRAAHEIYEAGRDVGYEAGRRAAAEALRARLGSTVDR